MKRFIILAFLLLLVWSCSKETKPIMLDNSTSSYSITQKNGVIRSYAQILAASMEDVELKSAIKMEAQKQFDGDYDILTSTMERLNLSGQNKSIRQKMSECVSPTRSEGGGLDVNFDEILKDIREQFPNLQVSIPVYCDEWNTEEYTPLVAYLPVDFDERTASVVEAFDTDGNVHQLSIKEEPDYPVIVVSVSERIDSEGNSIFDEEYDDNGAYIGSVTTKTVSTPTGLALHHSTPRSFELFWDGVVSSGHYEIQRRSMSESTFSTIAQVDGDENFYKDNGLIANTQYSYRLRLIEGNDQSAYTPILTSTASERTVGEPVKVVWYQMSQSLLQQAEPWIEGRPEIRLIVFYGVVSGSETPQIHNQLLSPTRKHIKQGCNPNATILPSWNPNTDGSVLSFVWKEEDNGGSYQFSVSVKYENKLSGGSISFGPSMSFSRNNTAFDIGGGYTCWWSPYSTVFNQGINFRLGS